MVTTLQLHPEMRWAVVVTKYIQHIEITRATMFNTFSYLFFLNCFSTTWLHNLLEMNNLWQQPAESRLTRQQAKVSEFTPESSSNDEHNSRGQMKQTVTQTFHSDANLKVVLEESSGDHQKLLFFMLWGTWNLIVSEIYQSGPKCCTDWHTLLACLRGVFQDFRLRFSLSPVWVGTFRSSQCPHSLSTVCSTIVF